jgi:hypothetical protein
MEDQVQEDVSRETNEQSVESMGERPEWLPEKFKSPEDFANSYHNLESKIGQNKDSIREELMAEIESEAFSERPESAGDYLLPESLDPELAQDNPMLDWWANHCFENGMSQENFEQGIEMFGEQVGAGYSAEEEVADLGDNAVERIEAVGLFVDQIVPKESHLRDTIDDLCSTSEGIQVVELLMAQMQQTPFLDGTQPVQVLNEDKLKQMMQDPRYYGHHKDMEFVKQVNDGFKKLYG